MPICNSLPGGSRRGVTTHYRRRWVFSVRCMDAGFGNEQCPHFRFRQQTPTFTPARMQPGCLNGRTMTQTYSGKSLLTTRYGAILIAFSLAAGCVAPPPPHIGGPGGPAAPLKNSRLVTASKQPTPIAAYATPASQTRHAGDRVAINVTAVNTDLENLEIGIGPSPITDWAIEALRDGQPIGFSESGRKALWPFAAGSGHTDYLISGESLSTSIPLSNLYDLSSPGRYQFTFRRPVWSGSGESSIQTECTARAIVLIGKALGKN
jgi:hypothetical protein